jgi:PAS domain S-box-containing protein
MKKKSGWKQPRDLSGQASSRAPESRASGDEYQSRLFAAQQELREQHRNLLVAQEKLQATRVRYTALFDRAPIAYVVLDPSGAVLEINRTGALLLGKSAAMIRHMPLRHFLLAEDRAKFDDHLTECHREARGNEIELRFEIAGRGLITTRLITNPLQIAEHSHAELLMTIVDISELKRIEAELARGVHEREELLVSERAVRAELEQANRAKDEFLATLSHELRTPLNAILGWTQLLGPGQFTEEDLEHGLEVIHRNARAQAQLINDLLDMSRIASGKLRLQLAEVNLCEVLDIAVSTIRPAAEARRLHLEKEIPVEPVFVRGDSGRLQQIVGNLLTNAVKFTPDGGKISVRLERADEDRAEIVITDSGIGIDPRFLSKIFERFTQRDSTSTRQHGGLGLGLAIVEQLTQMHGGRVSAHSDGEGKGATFRVSLPTIGLEKSPGVLMETSAPASTRLDGVRILVVDDEPDARQVLCRALQNAGASVRVGACAAEGLRLLEAEAFDVLLSDIAMPGMDGCQLLQQVRDAERGTDGRLRAIALTAYSRLEDRQKAEAAGFDGVMVKPIELAALVAMLGSSALEREPVPSVSVACCPVPSL